MIVIGPSTTTYGVNETIDREEFIRSELAWPVSGLHPFHAVVMKDQNNQVCYAAVNIPDNLIKAGTVIIDRRYLLKDGPVVVNIYAQLEPLMCWRQETIDFHSQLYSYRIMIKTSGKVGKNPREHRDGTCNCSIKRQMVADKDMMAMVAVEYGLNLTGSHQERLAQLGQYFLNSEMEI